MLASIVKWDPGQLKDSRNRTVVVTGTCLPMVVLGNKLDHPCGEFLALLLHSLQYD